MNLKNTIEVLAFAVIFSFVFALSSLMFSKILGQSDQTFISEGLAAFAGAFSAFLFLRISEFLTKLYQRQVRHYNSLVALETQLNEIGGIIHDNLYILPNFIRVIKSGNVYFNNLRPIPVDKSHYENLYDLSLINELFSYNYQVRKINDDMETASIGYRDIKNALIERNISPEHYKINTDGLAEKLKQIELFLSDLQKRTIKLLARVRLQIRSDKPLGTRIVGMFIRPSGPGLKEAEIENEVKKINAEIEETKTQSQREIEAVLEEYRKQSS